MCCVHLSTFASRESDSRITNVGQSVIKTPKHLRIMPIGHGCIFFRKPQKKGKIGFDSAKSKQKKKSSKLAQYWMKHVQIF